MTKKIVLIALVALAVGLGLGLLGSNQGNLGSIRMSADKFTQGLYAGLTDQFALSSSGNLTTTGTVKIGSAGDALTRVNAGICYVKAYAATIAATSTAQVDCQATAAVSASGIAPLTGVTLEDAVSVSLSTTTVGSVKGGLVLAGASASTTQGYISLKILNLTGDTYTWPTSGNASGTATYVSADK